MRLLLDEHLSPRIALELRRLGHDVIATAERSDLRGLGDDRLAEACEAEGRALVTFDVVDHLAILGDAARLRRRHPGLVLLAPSAWRPSDDGIGALVRALAALIEADVGDETLAGRSVWLRAPLAGGWP